jgi:hypothetical protein
MNVHLPLSFASLAVPINKAKCQKKLDKKAK